MLDYERTQPRLIRAAHRVDHLAAAEEEEGGHARDAELRRELAQPIDVDLDEEGRVSKLLSQRCKRRSDALARPAPHCGEVDDEQLVGRLDLRGRFGIELRLRGWS